jgi:hypothetical protein
MLFAGWATPTALLAYSSVSPKAGYGSVFEGDSSDAKI